MYSAPHEEKTTLSVDFRAEWDEAIAVLSNSSQGVEGNNVKSTLVQIKASKVFLAQLDLLKTLPRQLKQLKEVNDSIVARLLGHLLKGLLQVVVYQLYGNRLKKHFINTIEELARLNKIDCSLLIKEALKELQMSINDWVIDRNEKRAGSLSKDLELARAISVVLDEKKLFEPVLWEVTRNGSSFAKTFFSFFSLALNCEDNETPKDTPLVVGGVCDAFRTSLLLKSLSAFLSQFYAHYNGINTDRCQTAEWLDTQANNLFSSVLIIIKDRSVPREAVTIGGHCIALLLQHGVEFELSLSFIVSLIRVADLLCPLQTQLTHQRYQVLSSKWLSMSSITQLSIIRGLLVELPSSVSHKSPSENLTFILFHFFSFCENENLVVRLYAIQAIEVWLQLSQAWINDGTLTAQAFEKVVPIMLEASAKNWDVNFPALKSQSFELWTTLLRRCVKQPSSSLSTFYERVMLLNGSCRKYQYLALESLMSEVGIDWVIEKQPYLVDHLLVSIASRQTKSAAIQFLVSFIRQIMPKGLTLPKKVVHNRLEGQINNASPLLQQFIRQVSQVLAGDFERIKAIVDQKNSNVREEGALIPEVTRLSCIDCLSSELSQHLLPVLGKQFPDLIACVLSEFLSTSKENEFEEVYKPWTVAEASLVLAAKLNGRARWTEVGDEEESSSLVIWSELEHTQSVVCHFSLGKCMSGVVDGDPLIRLSLIETACASRQTTSEPTQQEWALVKRICDASLRGLSPEERAKTEASVKKFIIRSVEVFRARAGINGQRLDAWLAGPCQRVQKHLEELHGILLRHIDSTAPFDRLSTALSVYVCLYQSIASIDIWSQLDRRSVCPFLFLPSMYSIWIALFNSNWEKQRNSAVQVLRSFPTFVNESVLVSTFTDLLCKVRQREYMGGAYALAYLASVSVFVPLCGKVSPTMKASVSEYEAFKNGNWLLKEFRKCLHLPQQMAGGLANFFSERLSQLMVRNCVPKELENDLNSTKALLELPLSWFDSVLEAIQRQLGSRCMYHDDMGPWKCHGLLHLLWQCIQLFPPCRQIMRLFRHVVELWPDIPKAKSDVLNTVATTLMHFSLSVTEIQWICTMEVIGVLVDGVDAVLLCDEITSQYRSVHDVSTGAKITELRITSINQAPSSGLSQRLVGVDCRGHPITTSPFNNQKELEEDVWLLSSWITVKEGAESLSSLFKWLDVDSLIDCLVPEDVSKYQQQLDLTGTRLLTLLLGIKHPAAMDKLYASCHALSRRLLLTGQMACHQLPSIWLKRLLRLIDKDFLVSNDDISTPSLALPPPLRRSYSLGLTFLAITTSDPSRYLTSDLLPTTLDFLLNALNALLSLSLKDQTQEEASSIIVHCLNVLRCLVRCTTLVTPCAEYIGRILTVSLQFLSHEKWAVRNSANLLFASSLDRATGGNWDTLGEDLHAKGRGKLVDWANSKRFSLCNEAESRDTQRKKARALADILTIHPPLTSILQKGLEVANCGSDAIAEGLAVAILLFLSKVSFASPSQADVQDVIDQVYKKVELCQLTSKNYHTRTMAGRTIVSTQLSKMTVDDQATSVLNAIYFTGIEKACNQRGNKVHIDNNCLHGVLAAVLEFVSRPNIAETLIVEFFTETTLQLQNILLSLQNVCRLPIAPLCAAVALQIIEKLLLEAFLNSGILPSGAKNHHWLISYAKQVAVANLPIWARSLLDLKSKGASSHQKVPALASKEVSAIRLLLLSDLKAVPAVTTKLLTYLIHESEQIKRQAVPPCMTEALRISYKALKLLAFGKPTERTNICMHATLYSDMELRRTLQTDLHHLIRSLETFFRRFSSRIKCEASHDLATSYGRGRLFVTATSFLKFLLKSMKLMVTSLCLIEDIHAERSAIDAIKDLLESLNWSRNPKVIQTVVLVGGMLSKISTVSTNTWEKALANSASPNADLNTRFDSLAAMKLCALPIGSSRYGFELWKRCLILLMDENPEIQLICTDIVWRGIRSMVFGPQRDNIQFFSNKIKCITHQELQYCSKILPSEALVVTIQTMASVFVASDIADWVFAVLTGEVTDFTIVPDLTIFEHEVLLNTQPPKSGRDGAGSFRGRGDVFDEEAANIFNEDGFFVQLLGKCVVEFSGMKLQKFIEEKTLETLVKQLHICAKLCSYKNTVSMGHVTHSLPVSPSFQALLVRTAISLRALGTMQSECQQHLQLKAAVAALFEASTGSGVHPFYKLAIATLKDATELLRITPERLRPVWFSVNSMLNNIDVTPDGLLLT